MSSKGTPRQVQREIIEFHTQLYFGFQESDILGEWGSVRGVTFDWTLTESELNYLYLLLYGMNWNLSFSDMDIGRHTRTVQGKKKNK